MTGDQVVRPLVDKRRHDGKRIGLPLGELQGAFGHAPLGDVSRPGAPVALPVPPEETFEVFVLRKGHHAEGLRSAGKGKRALEPGCEPAVGKVFEPVADRRLPVAAGAAREADRRRNLKPRERRHADDARSPRRLVGNELEGKAAIARHRRVGQLVVGAGAPTVEGGGISFGQVEVRAVDRQVALDAPDAHLRHPLDEEPELFGDERRIAAAPEPDAVDAALRIRPRLCIEPRPPLPVRAQKFESRERRHQLRGRGGSHRPVGVDGKQGPDDGHPAALGHPSSATTDTVTALGSTPQSAAAFLSMGGSLPCSAAQPLHETDQRPAAIIPKAAKTAAEPLVENRIPPSPQAFPPRRPGAPRQPVKILQQPPCFSRRHPHIGFKC